jgi:hypothetical protein
MRQNHYIKIPYVIDNHHRKEKNYQKRIKGKREKEKRRIQRGKFAQNERAGAKVT